MMLQRFSLHFLVALIFSTSIFAQLPREKVYLHFNKNSYHVGETVQFSTYLIDAVTQMPETPSNVVYVDLIAPNDSILSSTTLLVDRPGASGSFLLPKDTTVPGHYSVRAYTHYMRNFDASLFYQKDIQVKHPDKSHISSVDDLQVTFQPESGELLANHLNRVGVRVLDAHGDPIAVSGEIYDTSGNQVTTFTTYFHGTGIIQFIPEIGKQYRAVLNLQEGRQTYELPLVRVEGFLMQLNEWPDHYRISLRSNSSQKLNGYTLSAYQRSGMAYRAKLLQNNDGILVKIPKDAFETGPIQWLFADEKGQVLASRANFHGNINDSQGIYLDAFRKGDDAQLSIKADRIQKGHYSLSIRESTHVQRGWQGIFPYLQLQSDYREAENILSHFPHYSNPNWKRDLNYLMLSLDAQKLVYHISSMSDRGNIQITYQPEKGLSLYGTVFGPDGQGVVAQVSLAYKNENEVGQITEQTDASGRFVFRDCDFVGLTDVVLTAKSLNGDIKSSELRLQTEPYALPEISNLTPVKAKKVNTLGSASATYVTRKTAYDSNISEYDETKELQEVTVTGQKLMSSEERIKRIEMAKRKRRMLYKTPTRHLDFAETTINPNENILQALVARVPGIQSKLGDSGITLVIRGNNSFNGDSDPLVLLNNTPVSMSAISQILPEEVDFIDVLIGPKAAIYGARAGNGIVAVYTKTGPSRSKKSYEVTNTINFVHPGFITSTEDVVIEHTATEIPYWDPNLRIPSKAKVDIPLENLNKSKTYRASLIGISSNGQIVEKDVLFKI
ncbi:carboxypeptidase-like regulatory domain-containing protein [Allomuricauda sp. SCSIO 65647]|uniref:carboxypeptidase-like regulatory domain-containing protein n=1 Tax=Allomuricauda sp. SCSIO 65647 TaxID=2908843 RepID=UPI001F457752|nr:carboxypeptidase-like regulatory domain-containing protein [Muricauda sp. SCSIO 65647]UJH67431.1 Plug and carboxypeptidase regulatory-like domain-containing protein [Muricauda sp. SCSIO 65647]